MFVVHKNNSDEVFGWAKRLSSGVFETASKISHSFESSNQKGAKMAATILLDTREDILVRAVASAFKTTFLKDLQAGFRMGV